MAKKQHWHKTPYMAYVRLQACYACGRPAPSDPHHVKTRGAMGEENTVIPLCRVCHNQVHSEGVKTFAQRRRLPDLIEVALGYWLDYQGSNP